MIWANASSATSEARIVEKVHQDHPESSRYKMCLVICGYITFTGGTVSVGSKMLVSEINISLEHHML